VLAAISLDGDRELHDGFRGKTGSHAAALAAARVLVEAGCREVVLGTTVTRHNADHIADMFATVVRSGAHSWGLHLVAPEGRAALELVPRPEQLRRIAAFARSRRAQFPVELCNEWGSAGADDAYYRDRPFLCGAGRISLVVDPTGEVMPCTTTDVRESEGNVRDAPLDRLWREGFARFRQGGDPNCSDTSECWLQTRNGVRIAEAAFGSAARPRPKLVDFVPTKLIGLSHRTLAARGPDDRFASMLTRKAITATAVGLAVLGACTLSREPSEPSTTDGRADQPPRSEVTKETAGTTPPSTSAAPTEWPSSLDVPGQHAYGAWVQMDGPWKSSTLPQLLAWERGGAKPRIVVPRSDPGVDEALLASFERELARHVERGFGQGNVMDLLGLLEAAEHAALFDAAFAAHLWRAAELIMATDVEPRAKLHDRLARHHHVVLALVASTATLGPISQRPWLKKSAPPAGWREQQLPEGFERTARGLLSAGVIGPWDSVGISARFEGSKPPIVHRNGTSIAGSTVTLRQAVRWGRLDVLEFTADTRVLLPSAIEIDVPAGAALTHASLARLMSSSTRARLDALIDRALAGDRPTIAELEVLLPVACAQLRARLADNPDAAGAPALRTMLVGYEE
jgi:hypothetical protein